MNLYILVEDEKSDHKFIDHWMNQLMPTLIHVPSINDVTEHNDIIFSG